MLRLAPIYLISLGVLWLCLPEFRRVAVWFLFYLQNVHFAILGNFSFAGHSWTLAVEEQVYLLWPLLLLALSERTMLEGLVALVGSGIVTRLVLLALGMVAVPMASWHCLEKPILGLKHRFCYRLTSVKRVLRSLVFVGSRSLPTCVSSAPPVSNVCCKGGPRLGGHAVQ
jgi:peptidoglycan/LPS O-acetylase OafA/YrhL